MQTDERAELIVAESIEHAKLIEIILKYVKKTYSGTQALIILDDRSQFIGSEKPPRINGFVPDVYVQDMPETFTLIGEAKTARDLESERSKLQIIAFCEYLSKCETATFILSTEWKMLATGKCLMRYVQRQLPPDASLEIILLDEMMLEPIKLPRLKC